jgi:hypothetical protein
MYPEQLDSEEHVERGYLDRLPLNPGRQDVALALLDHQEDERRQHHCPRRERKGHEDGRHRTHLNTLSREFPDDHHLVKVKQVFEKGLAAAPPATLPVPLGVVILILLIAPRGTLPRTVDDLVEFPPVQPDSTTLGAVINLNFLAFSNFKLNHT